MHVKILPTSIYFPPPIKRKKILPTNVYVEGKHRETKDKYALLSLGTCFPFIRWNWKMNPVPQLGKHPPNESNTETLTTGPGFSLFCLAQAINSKLAFNLKQSSCLSFLREGMILDRTLVVYECY